MTITTPHTALADLQTVAYTTLIANTAFTSLSAGPFDPAPENEVFPYTTFGEHSEKPWYKFGNTGRQVLFILHIWSQQNGFAEAYSVLDVITGALETQTLTLTHFTMVNGGFLFNSSTKLNDPDGITRHLVARYDVYLVAK